MFNIWHDCEVDTSAGILEAVMDCRVFTIERLEETDEFIITEDADKAFSVKLSKEEMKQLGEEIIKLATT